VSGRFYTCDPAGREVFGEPFPASGVRVVFDPAKLAAFGAGGRLPPPHLVRGEQGLAVFETPMDAQRWPCRLWRVDDVVEVFRPVGADPYFVRCGSFVVREELPGWLVLGRRGYLVARLVARARVLGPAEAAALAGLADEAERRVHSAVFDRWVERYRRGDHGHGRLRPGGYSLSAALEAVDDAARRVGPQLFGWVDDAVDEPVLADRTWRRARRAALAAALALGAPDLLGEGEFEVLTYRWRTVVGLPSEEDGRVDA